MVVDPNGQASVSYLDAKGRTIATALAGPRPANLSAIAEYDEVSGDNTERVEVNIMDNIVSDDQLTSTYSLLVPETGDYNICYVLSGAEYCADSECPGVEEVVDSACSDCRYDVRIRVSSSSVPCNDSDLIDETIELTDTTTRRALGGCFSKENLENQLNLTLPLGEYLIEKTIRVSERGVLAAIETFSNTENTCLLDEGTFVTAYVDAARNSTGALPSCQDCDCSLPRASLAPDCQTFCADVTPCDALRQQIEADLRPGGQYATFGYDPDNGTYIAPELDVLSIFSSFGTGGTEPYYKDVTFDPSDNVVIGEESVSPNSMNIDQFIRSWQDSWLDNLENFHPEICFARWCESKLEFVPGGDEFSSFTFESELKKESSLSTIISTYVGSVDTSNPRIAFASIFQSLSFSDPFFNAFAAHSQTIFNATYTNSSSTGTSEDIPGMVVAYLNDSFADGGTWAWNNNTPEYQLNIAWQILRGLYLGRKGIYVEQQQLAYCQIGGNNGEHSTNWECLNQPICENEDLDCSDPPARCDSGADAEYGSYDARWVHTTRIELMVATDVPLDDFDIPGLEANAQDDCEQRCSSYRPAWEEELRGCSTFTDSDIAIILNRFEAICETGCADGQYWGTSSVPYGQTRPEGFRDFQHVLYSYVSCADEVCNGCGLKLM